MLTLEEAIAHCEEKAEELRQEAESWTQCNLIGEPRRRADKAMADCLECAREHEQLAEWLTELKKLRETMEMIKKYYILVEKSPRDNSNDFMTGRVVPDVLQGWKYKEGNE